ncbi:MAG: GNAT family N-acetyltransferase [Pseudomonadota bacterium]
MTQNPAVSFHVPVLETERLNMRAFRQDTDFEPYAEFYASEETRYYGGPLDREGAWRAAAAMMGHWIIRGYGAWAVEEKATGEFCGLVGLWYPEDWPEREITWAIVSAKQGRGFAAEAALRAKSYAVDTLGWDRVYSCIAAENSASIALAEKLGAVFNRELGHPKRGRVLVYRHTP